MIVPGSNLLNKAFSLIVKQSVTYHKYVSRSLNDIGQDIAVYESPATLTGSVQAIERKLYREMGLDFQRDYIMFYTSNDILDIERDVSGDLLEFQNERYQCLSLNNWFNIDSWVSVLCVRVGDIPDD